jgi:hypothetical protein
MDAADLRALVDAYERREELLPDICRSRSRTEALDLLTGEHGLTAVVAEHLLDARIGSVVESAVADLRSQAHDDP